MLTMVTAKMMLWYFILRKNLHENTVHDVVDALDDEGDAADDDDGGDGDDDDDDDDDEEEEEGEDD